MLCGTQWEWPNQNRLKEAISAMACAIWGPNRRMRAREIVLGVLNDVERAHPCGAIIYILFVDARRVLNKGQTLYDLTLEMFYHIKNPNWRRQRWAGEVPYTGCADDWV